MRTAFAATVLLMVGCSFVPQSRFDVPVDNPTGHEVWLLVLSEDGETIHERIRVGPQDQTVRLPTPDTENWQLFIEGQEGFFDGRELFEWHRQYGSCETFILNVGDPAGVTTC